MPDIDNGSSRLLNSKVGWAVGGLGIPLAAILTWVFSAGQLSYITNQNAAKIADHDNRIRIIEGQEIRRDGQYEEITRRLNEIRDEIRSRNPSRDQQQNQPK